MKVVALYRQNSEHGRNVEEFIHEFSRRTSKEIEHIDIDSKEGSSAAELYDITEYPAILAIANDGSLQNMWIGEPLPLIDEVAAYLLERLQFAGAHG